MYVIFILLVWVLAAIVSSDTYMNKKGSYLTKKEFWMTLVAGPFSYWYLKKSRGSK